MSCSIAFIMTIMRTLWRALEIRNVIKPIYNFLDIEFGEVYGMDVAKIITRMNRNAGIVYITNYEEYAIKAFVCRPLGFIRKNARCRGYKMLQWIR